MQFIVLIFFVVFFSDTAYSNGYEIHADDLEFDDRNQLIIAQNNVKAKINQYKITADKILYNLQDNNISLSGNITINDTVLDSTYHAQSAFLDLSNNKIIIQETQGVFKNAKLAAKSIQYNQKLYESQFITMSLCNTCENGQSTQPLWQIRAKKLTSNIQDNDEIKLYNVYFDIFDKQVAYLPFFSLPTSWAKGKTGFLTPKLQNKGLGYQLDLPFYFKARQNLDFTFYPAIGKKSIYGLNTRYKVANGGYESTIYTGSLPFIKGNNTTETSIFRTWPANIKINSNLFYPLDNKCIDTKEGYELGFSGELALGAQPILLYKYDISDRKILVGDVYANTTHNSMFASVNAIHLHNLKLNTRTTSLPKTTIHHRHKIQLPYNPFSAQPEIITNISTNNIYNETFTKRLSDALGQVKLITKHNPNANNKITYSTQLTGYKSTHTTRLYNHQQDIIATTLDIHWQSKFQHNRKFIEPHAALHLQQSTQPLFAIDQSQIDNEDEALSIYSTTNNINPNNIFSSGAYTTNARSIMQKNGTHLDYGLIFSTYESAFTTKNKLFLTLAARQHLTKQSQFGKIITYNQDLSLAMLQDTFKEKYTCQLSLTHNSLSISNRTWLTNNLNLLTNEFYLNKNFSKLSTGIQHIFFNPEYNFDPSIKQKKFEQHIKLQVAYNLTENLSTGIRQTIKLGQDSAGQHITEIKHIKGKIQYSNECIQIGFTIKKEFDKRKYNTNNNISSYNLYVKIPTI